MVDTLPWAQEALAKQKAGNLTGALLAWRRVLSRDPDHPDAWCNLAVALHGLGRAEEAWQACAEALRLAPGNPAAHTAQGNLLAARGDLEAALACYRRALDLAPDDLAATAQMAAALLKLGRAEAALEADRAALALAPERADLRLNLGFTLMRMLRLEEAERELGEALARRPDLALARWNLAYLHLLQGRLREAWPDFGARLEVPQGLDNLRGFREPAWDGGPFPGRTLLVWAEQGLGDTLQFARYLPRVKALGGTVLLQAYGPLRALLEGLPGADRILGDQDPLPPFDLQAPLMDLPARFGDGLEDLPPPAALRATRPAPPELAGPGRRIGLVWAGSAAHQDDARRSLDPSLLAPLAALAGIRWFSLQLGPGPRPDLPGLVDLAPRLGDLADTAAAVARMDAVISVDTAVAHLAGSLGVRTHLLLPHFPDWRWLLARADSPWYPSLVLHRQPAPGDWRSVIAALAEELAHGC